jgi:tripartite-type tricarboxylate transporter receptor subunit TctC
MAQDGKLISKRYELAAWVGVFVRAKTSPEIIAKLNDLVTAFVNSTAARIYLATVGATPFPSTPQELGALSGSGYQALVRDRRVREN